MKYSKFLFLIVSLSSLLIPQSGFSTSEKMQKAKALGDKHCNYRYFKAKKSSKNLLITLGSMGKYSLFDKKEISSVPSSLHSQDKLDLLVVDKPGISFDLTTKKMVVDETTYLKYSMADLVECHRNVFDKIDGYDKIIYSGLGEGSNVILRLLPILFKKYPKNFTKIKSVVLAGIGSGNFFSYDIKLQLGQKRWDLINTAIKNNDEKIIHETLNKIVGLAWFQDVKKYDDVSKHFLDVLALKPEFKTNVFVSLNSIYIDSTPILVFEKSNADSKLFEKLNIRYYNSYSSRSRTAEDDLYSTIHTALSK